MQCKFNCDNGLCKCEKCGYTIQTSQNPNKILRKCNPSISEPNLVHKAINIATEALEWVKSGLKVNDEQEEKRRLEICNTCENFANGTCKLCGCYMNLKAKLGTSHCPIGKW